MTRTGALQYIDKKRHEHVRELTSTNCPIRSLLTTSPRSSLSSNGGCLPLQCATNHCPLHQFDYMQIKNETRSDKARLIVDVLYYRKMKHTAN